MNTVFKTSSFTDYKGIEHKFVVAGIVATYGSDEVNIEHYADSEIAYDDNGNVIYSENNDPVILDTTETIAPVYKIISIGISICNPMDEFVEWRGQKQAEGRADKYHDRVIALSKGGMCTEETVQFFVDQTVENLKNNPALFIRGYKEAEKRYYLSLKKND